MGLFDFFKSKQNRNTQFVSEQAFQSNLIKQMQLTPQTIGQLRKMNVSPEKELKLEYFFYTNTDEKAELFANEIAQLGYEVEYGQTEGDNNYFIITGWSTKMKMQDDVVINWTKEMCELGYKFDCDFDGWGTTPSQ